MVDDQIMDLRVSVQGKIHGISCIFHDCEAYGIELRTLKFTILDTQSILSPRIVPDANMALSTHIKIRLHILKTNSDFYEKCKFLVLQEIYLLRSYRKDREIYSNKVNLCEEMELYIHRQKAMKKEFVERKRRLESLRTTRVMNLRSLE